MKPLILTENTVGVLSRSEMKNIMAGSDYCGSTCEGDYCDCPKIYGCYASMCSYCEWWYEGTYGECLTEALGLWGQCEDDCLWEN